MIHLKIKEPPSSASGGDDSMKVNEYEKEEKTDEPYTTIGLQTAINQALARAGGELKTGRLPPGALETEVARLIDLLQ